MHGRIQNISGDAVQPSEYAQDIAVDRRFRFVKGERSDRSHHVRADTGQSQQFVTPRRNFAIVLRLDFLHRLLQKTRASIVTEPLPGVQNFFRRSLRHRLRRRKFLQPVRVVSAHRLHARLLQHNFRYPGAVRRALFPPGEFAAVDFEPVQQFFNPGRHVNSPA